MVGIITVKTQAGRLKGYCWQLQMPWFGAAFSVLEIGDTQDYNCSGIWEEFFFSQLWSINMYLCCAELLILVEIMAVCFSFDIHHCKITDL